MSRSKSSARRRSAPLGLFLCLLSCVLGVALSASVAGCSGDDAGSGIASPADPSEASATTDPDASAGQDAPATNGADGANDDASDSGPYALSVADVAVSEGNAGTKTLTFVVSLLTASTLPITVAYATADGTATTSSAAVAGADYSATSGTLTFAPGDTVKTISVQVNADTINEADETFSLTLSSPTNASLGAAVATGTIQNDDADPAVSIADTVMIEGDSGTTAATFAVTLSAASGQTVTVHANTADGTATVADSDYTAIADLVVTFAPGETTKNVVVDVVGDGTIESNETFSVTLSTPAHASIDTGTATATIQNDDGTAIPTVSIADVSVAEGNTGAKVVNVTVSLSAGTASTVTVDFTTADGTAKANAAPFSPDYDAWRGVLTFAPGVVSRVVALTILGDTTYETDETLSVVLSNAVNANILKSTSVVTIQNDDSAPTITVAGVTAPEGRAGAKPFRFATQLSAPSELKVTVDYATSDGTASTVGDAITGGLDYVAASGTIAFEPGQQFASIPVMVNGDALNEASEDFTLDLSGPTNATLAATHSVTGTITNDDAAPKLSVEAGFAIEGNTGTTLIKYVVTLSEPSARTVTATYTTGGTATAGTDYVAATDTVTFAPGDVTVSIGVTVNSDTAVEGDETVTMTLSAPSNATIQKAVATGTIEDDDGVLPYVDVFGTSVLEGNTGTSPMTFTVTLSAASLQTVTVDYASADGTAVSAGTGAGSHDYTAVSGTLSFAPGQVTKTIDITVAGDAVNEAHETMKLSLSNVSAGAALRNATATGTIYDDDAYPEASIGSDTGQEGTGMSGGVATVLVQLSAASGQTLTVDFATADGSAQAGVDYDATSGTVTFAPGETLKQIQVNFRPDAVHEAAETFDITLSNATASIAANGDVGTVVITDDDPLPLLSIANLIQAEGTPAADGRRTTSFAFTVSTPYASADVVSVDYGTVDGTALASNADYVPVTGTLTFPPGTGTAKIYVTVVKDAVKEPDESFSLVLSLPTNGVIVQGTGIATITNDD